MYFPPSRLEARDALDKLGKREPQRGGTVGPADPVDAPNPIESWFSVILGGGDPFETSTSTRRTSTSTGLTSSTRSTASSSTRTVLTVPAPTSTPVPTPTPSPSSSATPRSRSTLVVTTSLDSGNNAGQANDVNTSKGGLPSVVVGVIVAAAVIFGLIFISLIARKIFQSRRRRKRVTWAGTFEPPSDPREKELPLPPADTQEYTNTTTYPAYPPAAVTFANMNPPYSPAAAATYGAVAAPTYPFSGFAPQQATSNANATMFSSSAYAAADLAGPVVITQTPPTPSTTATAAVAASAPVATVKRTFIPSLPDELSIATGDRVRVLSVYDDGWALCEKVTTSEQGVVPQECLDTIPSTSINQNMPGQQLASGSGGSSEESVRLNRNSSLRRNQGQTY